MLQYIVQGFIFAQFVFIRLHKHRNDHALKDRRVSLPWDSIHALHAMQHSTPNRVYENTAKTIPPTKHVPPLWNMPSSERRLEHVFFFLWASTQERKHLDMINGSPWPLATRV